MTTPSADRAVIHGIEALPTIGPAALCMGVFDGVHRGHLALAHATIEAAARQGAASVALVFDPHPDSVVRPGTVVRRLAALDRNLRALADAGIDRPLAVRFDTALQGLTPDAFLRAMRPAIELRALVMTPGSAFGRNRAGTPDAMRALGASAGFELVVAGVVLDGGEPISSARIRAALLAGELATASRLLGHPLVLEGELSEPDGEHRRLVPAYLAALPVAGRYAARLWRAPDVGGGRGVELIVDGGGTVHVAGAADLAEGPVTVHLGEAR